MRRSIVIRLSVIVAGIICVAVALLVWTYHRSTTAEFAEARREIMSPSETGGSAENITRSIVEAYEVSGWPGVTEFVQDPRGLVGRAAAPLVVVDEHFEVVVSTESTLGHAVVYRTKDAGILMRAQSETGNDASEFEIQLSNPVVLRDAEGRRFGELILLPEPIDHEEGERFANKVWRSAAVWLVAVLLFAVGSIAWVMQRFLAPIDSLKIAARQLQDGEIPEPVETEASAEFAGLIEAFNAAADSIAQTESIRRRLITDIAHELRTPVTNLKGQLEAVDSGLVEPDAGFVATMQSETRLLERLVEDFQQLAIADAGQLRLHCQPIPLRESIENSLAPLAAGASAVVELDIPTHLSVVADEGRLRQVLVNLFENSARHVSGEVEIRVTARVVGPDVEIDFCDNGPGIDPEDRRFVFERFYRAEKSRNRATGGSGLGLTIVKGLIEAMGGSIRYIDLPDAGAVFRFSLPMGAG